MTPLDANRTKLIASFITSLLTIIINSTPSNNVCFLPLLFRNSFFSDRDVFIKGARDLVNRINAMLLKSLPLTVIGSYTLANRLARIC